MQIETERLLLEPLATGHVDDFLRVQSDPDVLRFQRKLDPASARARLELNEREWSERGYGMFAVREQAGGAYVGRAGFRYWPQFEETELGWVLAPERWGRGYATEAGRACIDWAFDRTVVPYLTSMIQAENARSLRVAARLGFSVLRDDLLDGIPVIVHWLERPAPGGDLDDRGRRSSPDRSR